jgi:hypothetical protein
MEILQDYKSLVALAASAATATTTATAAEIATTATAATAAGAFFAGTSDVDREGATIELFAVQSVDRFLGFIGAAHGYETKAAGTAADAVHHQVDFHNRTVGRKRVLEVVFRSVEGKISYKQFIVHAMIAVRLSLYLPDCSRPSGFKSSLNNSSPEDLPVLEETSI